MQFGTLNFQPVNRDTSLLAEPVRQFFETHPSDESFVCASDPTLADTAAYCKAYSIGMDVSANCVIVEAKRAERTWYAACIVLATTRADINGIVRRHMDARKISFASMDMAVTLTGMEYGAITPIGLPVEWPIFVDARVAATPHVIVGSGIRGSKILTTGASIGTLPGAKVLDIVKA